MVHLGIQLGLAFPEACDQSGFQPETEQRLTKQLFAKVGGV